MHAFRPNPAAWRPLTFIFGWLLSAGVGAIERPVLTLDLRPAHVDRPAQLRLAGTWPDSCIPRLLRVNRNANELAIQLQAAQSQCVPQPTPFEVPIEMRTAFGPAVPDPQVHRVRISVSRGDQPAELLGFRLLDLGAAGVRPESGFWWSRSGPDDATFLVGGGVGLEVQGGQIAVSLLAFTAEGVPTWYFGSADLDGRTAQVPLIRLLNGAGAGGQARVEPGPMLALEFAAPTQARAWLLAAATSDADAPLQLLPLQLRRAIFDERATGSSWLGTWVLVVGSDTRIVELTRLASEDDSSFRLLTAPDADRAGESLHCRYRGYGSSVEVEGCSLIRDDAIVARFGQVGLDRMQGTAAAGVTTQLLRVDR